MIYLTFFLSLIFSFNSYAEVTSFEISRSRPPGVVDRYIYKKQGKKEILISSSNLFDLKKKEAGTYTRDFEEVHFLPLKKIYSLQPKKRVFDEKHNFHEWKILINGKHITVDNPSFYEAVTVMEQISLAQDWKPLNTTEIRIKPKFKIIENNNGSKQEISNTNILLMCNKKIDNQMICSYKDKSIYL